LAIKKVLRIKKKVEFDTIFSVKDSVANKRFVVYQLSSGKSHFRVAISVSKKLGNAVLRNRVKRLVRHALRPLSQQLSKTDFVIICRKGVETLTFDEIQENLIHVLKIAKIYKSN
jgi:ribonuclease P protein component